MVLLDVWLWGLIHAATGYLSHRLPRRMLDHDAWLWRERRIEGGGSLYTRRLHVRRWQRHLPEAGDLFAGGYDKRHLGGRSTAALTNYLQETRRAEVAHWLALACAPSFLLFNPLSADILLMLYALASNGPCIASLRYNRIRLSRVMARRTARAAR